MSNDHETHAANPYYGQPHGGVRTGQPVEGGLMPPQAAPLQAAPQVTPVVEPQASTAAIAAGQGEPVASSDDKVVFSEPYDAHGESVSEVSFREPLGKDIARIGVPMRFVQPEDGGEQIEFKLIAGVISRYIVELSNPPLPKSTVDKFRPADWNACAQVINGFFQ